MKRLLFSLLLLLGFVSHAPAVSGTVIDLQNSDKTYDQLLASGNVVVDFYTDWCGPCKRMYPIIQDKARSHTNITFIKVNIESRPDIAARYKVRSIPTLMFFKNGKLVKEVIGYKSAKEIEALIKQIF